MPTAGDLVSQVLTRVGFDATPQEGLELLNERYSTMCVRAELLTPTIEIGPTVAGQSDYPLPANVAGVKRLTLGGMPVEHESSIADGYGCGYAVVVSDAAAWMVRVLPAPSEAGQTLAMRVVQRPPDLTADDVPLVPRESLRALREGMTATLFAEDAEQANVADRLEARFDTACEELRRQLRHSRRSGPARIQVVR